ncbi:MAG: DUF4190 domain-containing protein [Pseudoclavibacter sp.]
MTQPAPYSAGGVAPQEKTNVLSIVTLILGILGFAIVPVITGHISLNQIKNTGEGGKVMAIIGLVLGYLGVIGWIIAIIAWVAIIGAAATSGAY